MTGRKYDYLKGPKGYRDPLFRLQEQTLKTIINRLAGVMELADMPDLGSGERSCRFDPCHPHQIWLFMMFHEELFYASLISIMIMCICVYSRENRYER